MQRKIWKVKKSGKKFNSLTSGSSIPTRSNACSRFHDILRYLRRKTSTLAPALAPDVHLPGSPRVPTNGTDLVRWMTREVSGWIMNITEGRELSNLDLLRAESERKLNGATREARGDAA